MAVRDELHLLIDNIPESDVPLTLSLLRSLIDPVELAILRAPEDDEPESEQESRAVAKALSDPSPDVPFENIRRVS